MKKLFILLGKEGLILYSWIFIILFSGLIIAYESMEKINWPAIIIVIIFAILFIYSLNKSYYTDKIVSLPYKQKIKLNVNPIVFWSWKKLSFQAIKIDNLQTIYILRYKK